MKRQTTRLTPPAGARDPSPLPVRIAVRLLDLLGPEDEALAGDILEQYGAGRSWRWLHGQVLMALAYRAARRLRGDAWAGGPDAVVAVTMLGLLSFYAVFLVNLAVWGVLQLSPPLAALAPPLPWWLHAGMSLAVAVVAGLGIGRVHHHHRSAAMLLFTTTVTLFIVANRAALPTGHAAFLPSPFLQLLSTMGFISVLLIAAGRRSVVVEHA